MKEAGKRAYLSGMHTNGRICCALRVKNKHGDREVYTINDKDKERIKAFVRSIQDEWERSREKDYYAQE